MHTELIRVGNALDHPDMQPSAACCVGNAVHTAGILPIDPDGGQNLRRVAATMWR